MRITYRVLLLGIGLPILPSPLAAQTELRKPTNIAAVLQRPANIRSRGITLRDACRRLTQTQHLPIFVDRRVDPLQRMNIQAEGVTLQEALTSLAQQAGAEVAILPSLCYLGPKGTALELPTLLEVARQQADRMPVAFRRKLSMKQKLRWQRLASPQQILRDLTQSHQIQVVGLEQVPHDLWDAGELPEGIVAEHLTVLLAGFDLTWRLDQGGDAVRLVPIERPVRLARSYTWRGAGSAQLQQVAAQIPAADVRIFGGKVELNGTAEDHEKLLAILSNLRPPARNSRRSHGRTPERKRYSLRLQSEPVGAVLRELASQIYLELRVDEPALRNANLSLDTRISIDVTEVDLDTLLESIGKAAGLSLKATAAELHVAPR